MPREVFQEMNEELVAFEKAIDKFFKIVRDDVLERVSAGVVPVAYIIAFREPTRDQYETMRYTTRCTRDCPPGLEGALEEVLGKWIERTYGELLPVDEMPAFKQ